MHVYWQGRETELHSKHDADVFAKVLQGSFVAFPFWEIRPAPSGSTWVTDGLFLELTTKPPPQWSAELRVLQPDELVLQVSVGRKPRRGRASEAAESSVVYLLQSGTLQLLHMPAHVFDVLAAHEQYHHVDRHFATHVASYARTKTSHMLINAHPIFGNAAYAAGCINEVHAASNRCCGRARATLLAPCATGRSAWPFLWWTSRHGHAGRRPQLMGARAPSHMPGAACARSHRPARRPLWRYTWPGCARALDENRQTRSP